MLFNLKCSIGGKNVQIMRNNVRITSSNNGGWGCCCRGTPRAPQTPPLTSASEH